MSIICKFSSLVPSVLDTVGYHHNGDDQKQQANLSLTNSTTHLHSIQCFVLSINVCYFTKYWIQNL